MAANPTPALFDQDRNYPETLSKRNTNENLPPEDTDDGGAIIKITPDRDERPTADANAFYKNLVPDLDSASLSRLGLDLVEFIERDKDARKDRDDKYAQGIRRTGLGDEAPGGPAFVGASEAVHPMITKATIYYQSHTIGELFPPSGPVKDDIVGTSTPARIEKAKRKCAHMNWQFRRQMPECRNQLEKLLSQQPLGGSQYMRLVYDSVQKRPVPCFFSIDDCYLPDGAGDFYSAERRTFRTSITQTEFDNRIRSKYYVKPTSLAPPPLRGPNDQETESEKAQDKVQGVEKGVYNQDGYRTIFIVEALADIEDTEDLKIAGDRPKMEDVEEDANTPLPYLMEVDASSSQILRITRNWEEDDPLRANMCWAVDFEFIPWEGAQSVGLIHLAGSLAGAGTGSLRALLDAALVNNLQTGLKLKGSGMAGQTLGLNIGQLTEIEGGVGAKDIREIVMPLPFNPPSQMLYQLLGWCTEQGEELVRTTFENLSQDGAPNMPVGTTLALIEQGLKVLSAIHKRLHHGMDRLIGVLHRINRLYITDDQILDEAGEQLAYRTDYEGPVDVVPVSDPEVFSDVQRFAQLQIIQQRADMHPELYDSHKVETLILQRTKLPNAANLLRPLPQITEMNQVNENVAMSLGRPVAAYPEQDHLAHIQVLLDFLQSPVLGGLPTIQSKFLPPAVQHLSEHILYWYVTHIVDITSQAAGMDTGKIARIHHKNKEVGVELDRTLAAASKRVIAAANQTFQQIPAIIQQAMQKLQSMQQPSQQQADPTAMGVANIRAQAQAATNQSREKIATMQQQGTAQKGQQDNATTLQQTQVEQAGDTARTQAEIEERERINAEDNATALEIAAAKIDTGHSTNISTGTGIEGHPSPGGEGKGV
jgi:hypothetical protein